MTTSRNSGTNSTSRLTTYQWDKAMERNIITMDGQGNITLPSDTGSITMSEWELCELFGVIAPTIRTGIKALSKSAVLREHEIRHTIRLSDKRSMELYNLEAIIALAFRINTFGAKKIRNEVLKMICGRKEKVCYLFSLTNSSIGMS